MNIEERLKTAQEKSQELVNKLNQLESDKQEIIKEFLRLEGEIRAYNKLRGEENGVNARPRNKSR